MYSNELQAVVIAFSNGLSELTTSVDKCLLPIANKPMIYFPLYALEKSHFTEVIIVCTKNKEDKIRDALVTSLKINIEFFNIPQNEDIGTADALRLLEATNKIKTDFILIGCDSFISFPLVKMINTYRSINPTLAILMSPINVTSVETLVPGSKEKFDCVKNLIAVDSDNDNRILLLEPDSTFDDEISLYSPLVTNCTNFCVLNDLIDCHVYIFKKWILGYLKHKIHLRSVKDELIPKLISNQFKSVKNKENKEVSKIWDFYEKDNLTKALDKVELNDNKTYTPIKCIAYIEETAICMRCNEISTYFEANHIARKLQFSPIDESAMKISSKGINDSLVDNSVIYGEKCSINACNIGKGCKIGKKSKIQHCVIGENVVIKEGANIQNSIISNGASIGQNAEIKQCIIAAGKVIVDLSKLNQEVIVDSVL